MNFSLLKENYEKYKELKNEIKTLRDYGLPAVFAIAGLTLSVLSAISLSSDSGLSIHPFTVIFVMVASLSTGIILTGFWNRFKTKGKIKKNDYLEKFGFKLKNDVVTSPFKLNEIERKYQEIPNTGFNIKELANINTENELSFLIDILELKLKEKNIDNVQEIEDFIFKEITGTTKIKLYKKLLIHKLTNKTSEEILKQKDEVIKKSMDNFNKKEILEIMELLEEKINDKTEENLEKAIQEKLKDIEKASLKLENKEIINIERNKLVKSI